MTETPLQDAPPPPPPPPYGPPLAPPLVRPRDGRVLSGVCLALARSTGTDPVLWRVLIAVLAVFGGTGLLLYVAGWLLIPEEGQPQSTGERWLRSRDLTTPATLGLVVVAAVVLVLAVDEGEALVPLAVVGLVAWLVVRRRQEGLVAPPTGAVPTSGVGPPPFSGAPAPFAATTYAGAYGAPYAGPPFAAAPPYGPQPPWGAPPPKPPKSALGLLTACAALVVVGGMLLADAAGADGITAVRVLGAALTVVALGLLVGARLGRARWLVPVGLVLALAVTALAGVDRRFGSTAGERTWVVTGSTVERLGTGEAVLDLRQLGRPDGVVDVEASVGAGELLVLLPEDLTVELDARVGLGELEVDADERSVQGGTGLDSETRLGPAGTVDVTLDVEVGVGALEVRRVPS